jgi:hypothetical protein
VVILLQGCVSRAEDLAFEAAGFSESAARTHTIADNMQRHATTTHRDFIQPPAKTSWRGTAALEVIRL